MSEETGKEHGQIAVKTRDLRVIVKALEEGGMRCNCDLDNWTPEISTGHSHVCRIHKVAIERAR